MNRTLIYKRKYLVKDKMYEKAGIYKISCIQSDKIYIGESLDLYNRIQKHFTNLRKGKHHNPILQNIYNKYGEESMIVEVLEYIERTFNSKQVLRELEKQYQEQYKDYCINFDKNTIAWNNNSTPEQKLKNKLQLDSIRSLSMEVWKRPFVIYNTKTGELFNVDSLLEATKYVNERHIYKNIKKDFYIPFNSFVCFEPNNVDLSKIYYTYFEVGTPIKRLVSLYNILTKEQFNFAGVTDAGIFLGLDRHRVDWYSKHIGINYYTTKLITNLEELYNTDICFYRHRTRRVIIKFKDAYDVFVNNDIFKISKLDEKIYKQFNVFLYTILNSIDVPKLRNELITIANHISDPFIIKNPKLIGMPNTN